MGLSGSRTRWVPTPLEGCGAVERWVWQRGSEKHGVGGGEGTGVRTIKTSTEEGKEYDSWGGDNSDGAV